MHYEKKWEMQTVKAYASQYRLPGEIRILQGT
jgi:hypothetical protein